MNYSALITIAGLSKRMGDFKPLFKVGDKYIIQMVVDSLISANCEKIVTVLGYRAPDIKNVLRCYGDKLICIVNEDYENCDMFQSIKEGLCKLPPCDAFFFLPGDMPAISKSTFESLKREYEGRKKVANSKIVSEKIVVFPLFESKRKHPPLIDYSLKDEILNYCSQNGLRGFFLNFPLEIYEVNVDDIGVCIDLDYKKDFQNNYKLLEKLAKKH